MKKRTGIELIVFAAVAVFYLFTLFTESKESDVKETSNAIETKPQTEYISNAT